MAGLAPLLLVWLAAIALGRWRAAGLTPGERWVLAPAVGLGGASLLFFWWRLAGLPPGALAVPLFALALVLASTRGRGGAPPTAGAAPRRRWQAGHWILAGATALALAVCLLRLLQQPLGEYDAVAIWNARALTIWRADEPLAPLFARLTLSHAHPDYPLLLPGAVAASFAVGGGESVAVPQVASVLWLFAAAGAVWAGVRHVAGAERGRLAAALFLTTPEALFWGPAQCADLVVACLLALGAAGLARELEVEGSPPAGARAALTGFVLSLLPWAKNEGLLLLGVLVLLWLALGLSRHGIGRRRALALAAGAAPGLATLAAFKLLWSPHAELPDFARGALARMLDPERWRTVLAAFAAEANPFGAGSEWAATPLLLLAAALAGLAAARRRGPAIAFLRLALAGSLALWLAIYLGTPADLSWHLDTSLDRLLLQLLPLACLWGFSELPSARRAGPAAGPVR